jgi:uncharacterized protein (DUF1697 family)
MTTFVAFLRGMNLGNRRITNDELCASFARIGFADASAFMASGNVIFSADATDQSALRETIERGLRGELDYEVPTFLRDAGDIAHIADHTPFSEREVAATEGRLQVGLLHAAPSPGAREAVLEHATDDDRLAVDGRELYWLPRAGISTADLDLTALGDDLGGITIRTHRTVQRLRARVAAG